MKKVVSLVLAVLVVTVLGAQVFATSSVTSGDILVDPTDKGLVVTPKGSTPAVSDEALAAQITATLNGISDSDVKAIDSSLDASKYQIVLVFDATLLDGSDHVSDFTIKVPSVKSSDDIKVYHRLDGEWKVETATPGDGTVAISGVTKYSPFVVVKAVSNADGTSPATGNQMIAVYGVGALVFAAAAVLLLRKRENA